MGKKDSELTSEDRTRLIEYRSHLQDIDFQASRDRDKAVLTLSSGALLLSVAFLSDIRHPVHQWLLITSWGLFVVALLAVVLSFEVSQHDVRAAIGDVDEQLANPEHEPRDFDSTATRMLNWAAIGAMLLGFTAFALFGAFNLGR